MAVGAVELEREEVYRKAPKKTRVETASMMMVEVACLVNSR